MTAISARFSTMPFARQSDVGLTACRQFTRFANYKGGKNPKNLYSALLEYLLHLIDADLLGAKASH